MRALDHNRHTAHEILLQAALCAYYSLVIVVTPLMLRHHARRLTRAVRGESPGRGL